MKIAIAGGGAAGLLAALLLARAGHEVVVAEQDRFDASLDIESAAATAFRAAAPHIVQPHALMARCRQLLAERLPDVYARLLLQGASHLVDTLNTRAGDSTAQALALDQLVNDHVRPYYEDQAVIDAERLATLRHHVFGAPPPGQSTGSDRDRSPGDRVTFPQVRAAATADPLAFRAFWQIQGMTRRPEQVYTDPRVIAATRATLADLDLPRMAQPSRARLLAALTGMD